MHHAYVFQKPFKSLQKPLKRFLIGGFKSKHGHKFDQCQRKMSFTSLSPSFEDLLLRSLFFSDNDASRTA